MERRKWYFTDGTGYTLFNILFDNGHYMCVENDETKDISFGPSKDFNTLLGFPYDWENLTKEEAVRTLRRLIEIDEGYPEVRAFERERWGYTTIDEWNGMIDAICAI